MRPAPGTRRRASCDAMAAAGVAELSRVHEKAADLMTSAKEFVKEGVNSMNSVIDAALACEKYGDSERVEKLRAAFKELTEVETDARAHVKALAEISKGNHAVPQRQESGAMSVVGFTAAIEQLAQQAKQNPRQQENARNRIAKFEQEIWAVNHAGEAMPGQEDEDLVMEPTQGTINKKCPLCAVPLPELREPVQDEKGYVYEKEFILQYIAAKGRGGRVACPCPGTTHYVTKDTLEECDHMLSGGQQRKRPRAVTLDDD